jgi:hypothetical protein
MTSRHARRTSAQQMKPWPIRPEVVHDTYFLPWFKFFANVRNIIPTVRYPNRTLVCVGARATHFTGYCCWFMWGLGQHTLLDIVVGLCGASGNTLYWVLLLVYAGLGQHTLLGIVVGLRGPRATHFTGYCCWLMWGLWQHTLLLLVYTTFWTTHFTVRLLWVFSNGFKIIFKKIKVEMSISISPQKPLKRITPSQNKITWYHFPVS